MDSEQQRTAANRPDPRRIDPHSGARAVTAITAKSLRAWRRREQRQRHVAERRHPTVFGGATTRGIGTRGDRPTRARSGERRPFLLRRPGKEAVSRSLGGTCLRRRWITWRHPRTSRRPSLATPCRCRHAPLGYNPSTAPFGGGCLSEPEVGILDPGNSIRYLEVHEWG